MILWCIMRSPLMIGCEMTKNDGYTLNLLTNEGLMEMHACSRHAHQVFRHKEGGNEIILWTAMKSDGASGYDGQYVAVFNADGPDAEIEIPLSELELTGAVTGTDIVSQYESSYEGTIRIKVKEHGARAILVR